MVSCFVLFSCVLALSHPIAPIYIRPHPSAPAHTLYAFHRPHTHVQIRTHACTFTHITTTFFHHSDRTFTGFDLFLVCCVLLCVLSCRYAWEGGVIGDLLDLHNSTGCPIYGCNVVVSSLLTRQSFPPARDSPRSLYLCFSFDTCICIHLHPSERILTHLSPPCPCMSVHTHMSILGNFPCHKWTEIIP